jgi:hypothetical protein
MALLGASGKMEAVFDDEEITRYKSQMNELVVPDVGDTRAPVEALALRATQRDGGLAQFVALVARESAGAFVAAQAQSKPAIAIEAKTLLKLDEASALTGLSRATLRKAIDAGKLKGFSRIFDDAGIVLSQITE